MVILLLVRAALASSTYPTELVTALEMPCAPTCTVCHETNSGGAGTVTADFGGAMIDRGLTGGGAVDLLTAALADMEADAVDSDGDGEIDVDELASGADPNPGGAPFCDVVTPEYGCGSSSAASAFGLVGLGLLARRRGRAATSR